MRKDTFLSSLFDMMDKMDTDEKGNREQALSLLRTVTDEEGPLARAEEEYLRYFVLPTLSGIDCKKKPIPFNIQMFLLSDEIVLPWGEWLEYFPGSVVEVREDKQGGNTLLFGLPCSWQWAHERKAGIFYSPNGFNEKPAKGYVSRRSLTNVSSLNAIYLDFDGKGVPKEDMLDKVIKLPEKPSVIVETKNGYHAIYFIEPGCKLPDWQVTQTAVTNYAKSDPAGKDATRLLRMPGTIHCKEMWEGRDGFPVKLAYMSSSRYPLARLASSFKTNAAIDSRDWTLSRGTKQYPSIPNMGVLTEGERHGSLKTQAARAYAGLVPSQAAAARALVVQWYRSVCSPLKKNWREEAEDMCDHFEKLEFSQVISRT